MKSLSRPIHVIAEADGPVFMRVDFDDETYALLTAEQLMSLPRELAREIVRSEFWPRTTEAEVWT